MLSALLRTGEVVGGRYEILEVIGEGGMGTVFKARHTLSEHLVALKVLSERSADATRALERFKREASASARIGHPGLVQVLDAGVDSKQGGLFIAMELLTGETLGARFAAEHISTREKLEWLVELLEPLDALHAAGFVHRDLKPDNVFIARRSDGTEQVKLLDFGLAREIGVDSTTSAGTAFGTPHYMAPEQSVSARDVTSAADVWAAGVMLYEVLAGTKPFNGETPNAIIVAACTSDYAPLAGPALNRELASLVEACLTKQPEERLQTAGALRSALLHALRARPLLGSNAAKETTRKQQQVDVPAGTSPVVTDPLAPASLLNADTLELAVTSAQPQTTSKLNADPQPGAEVAVAVLDGAAASEAAASEAPESDATEVSDGAAVLPPIARQAGGVVTPPATASRLRYWPVGVLAVFLGGGASLLLASDPDHEEAAHAPASSQLAAGASAAPPDTTLPALPVSGSGGPAHAPSGVSAGASGGAERAPLVSVGSARAPAAAHSAPAVRSTAPQGSASQDDDPGYLEDWKGK